jgi:hypothetical protein
VNILNNRCLELSGDKTGTLSSIKMRENKIRLWNSGDRIPTVTLLLDTNTIKGERFEWSGGVVDEYLCVPTVRDHGFQQLMDGAIAPRILA